jgi:hypothetical protein
LQQVPNQQARIIKVDLFAFENCRTGIALTHSGEYILMYLLLKAAWIMISVIFIIIHISM